MMYAETKVKAEIFSWSKDIHAVERRIQIVWLIRSDWQREQNEFRLTFFFSAKNENLRRIHHSFDHLKRMNGSILIWNRHSRGDEKFMPRTLSGFQTSVYPQINTEMIISRIIQLIIAADKRRRRQQQEARTLTNKTDLFLLFFFVRAFVRSALLFLRQSFVKPML